PSLFLHHPSLLSSLLLLLRLRRPSTSTLFPYTTLFRSNKAAASNCFLDQFFLCFSWIDTKTVGFMDEHRYSPSLNENVRSIISYRNELYNVCKETSNSLIPIL